MIPKKEKRCISDQDFIRKRTAKAYFCQSLLQIVHPLGHHQFLIYDVCSRLETAHLSPCMKSSFFDLSAKLRSGLRHMQPNNKITNNDGFLISYSDSVSSQTHTYE